MKLIIVAGMIDAKLISKMEPIRRSPTVETLYLVRRQPFVGQKITGYFPPKWMRNFLPFAELYRLLSIAYLCLIKKPDALIALGTIPHGLYCSLLGSLFQIPVVQHVMGKNDLRLTFTHSRGKKLALKAVSRAQAIAVRGKNTQVFLEREGVAPDRLFCPQNVHDFTLFSPQPEVNKDFDLVYTGLLEPYKRIDLLLDALAIVKQTRPGIRCLVIGDGSQKTLLIKKAGELSLSAQVEFMGALEQQQLPPQLCRARLFIMTSQGEGLPQSMIEALSCHLPAIVLADADIETVARHEINSLIVPEHRAEDFASAVIRLLQDSTLYERLVSGCEQFRADKCEEYTLEYQQRLWEERLSLLLTNGR